MTTPRPKPKAKPRPPRPEGPARDPRRQRLVVCLDGTSNHAFKEVDRQDGTKIARPTNVLKVARHVSGVGDDGVRQVVYYDPGVGTRAKHAGAANRVLGLTERALGSSVGAGFEENVEAAVEFLALNHRRGDDVFIYGFSRGAAEARAVAQFIDWAGGLPSKMDVFWLPYLFRDYVASGGKVPPVWVPDGKTRHHELVPVRVSVLGVWDTVTSLASSGIGIGAWDATGRFDFHVRDRPPRCVVTALQVLAIDERRWDFRPEIWVGPSRPGQTVRQRWFAGVHSGVGGGLDPDGLANETLRWIKTLSAEAGLHFERGFNRFTGGYAQDALSNSHTWFWKLPERLRLRYGKGVRELGSFPRRADGQLTRLGPEAGIELAPSVIRRLQAVPGALNERGEPKHENFGEQLYRPENLLRYLAAQPADLDTQLAAMDLKDRTVPQDVRDRVEALRRGG